MSMNNQNTIKDKETTNPATQCNYKTRTKPKDTKETSMLLQSFNPTE